MTPQQIHQKIVVLIYRIINNLMSEGYFGSGGESTKIVLTSPMISNGGRTITYSGFVDKTINVIAVNGVFKDSTSFTRDNPTSITFTLEDTTTVETGQVVTFF